MYITCIIPAESETQRIQYITHNTHRKHTYILRYTYIMRRIADASSGAGERHQLAVSRERTGSVQNHKHQKQIA